MMNNEFSKLNKGRPLHVTDFDLKLGLHQLEDAYENDDYRVWKTPLWINYILLSLFTICLLSLIMIVKSDWFKEETSTLWGFIIAAILLFVSMVVIGFFATSVFHRGKLVLDKKNKKINFYRSLLFTKKFAEIYIAEINAMKMCSLDGTTNGNDDTPVTYKVLVVELKNGDLVSVSFDSSNGISSAIKKLVG